MNKKILLAASVAAMPLLLASPRAMALDVKLSSIELLGKHVFFDEALSRPSGRQACASCHDPARGWVLPNSAINETTVVAPGARKRRVGSIKTPANAYASFSPRFQSAALPPGVPPGFLAPWRGGVFWDGRAEGCGATAAVPNPSCPVGNGAVSETVRWADLPPQYQVQGEAGYVRFLGPVADQALNPFPNDVEQNIQERKVCRVVMNGKYADLYTKAFGEEINCKAKPDGNPAYQTSFKRLAVALSAWQSSADVNSFTSKRDDVIRGKKSFTTVEAQGHDIFYGLTTNENPSGKNARCSLCHNGVPEGQAADPQGTSLTQLYADQSYHNIGIPFNREITNVPRGEKKGLSFHVIDAVNVQPGFFKTPTMRNVGKGAGNNFTKAYGHNGYFKSLKQIVHFYNTRDLPTKPPCADPSATVEEAISNSCWPAPEFPGFIAGGGPANVPGGNIIGELGLSDAEEDAIVAYLNTLSDSHTPNRP